MTAELAFEVVWLTAYIAAPPLVMPRALALPPEGTFVTRVAATVDLPTVLVSRA